MSLKQLLLADLERQFYYTGRIKRRVSVFGVFLELVNPRFLPIVIYRLAYFLNMRRIPVLGKLLATANFILFGLEIALRCEIGPGVYIAHTNGTVIGARRIGRNALIYHQVTLGAKNMDIGYHEDKRPIVGNGVTIGSGAKVLGGIAVGDNAVIGANAVVTRCVPEGAVVGGIPARIIKQKETD